MLHHILQFYVGQLGGKMVDGWKVKLDVNNYRGTIKSSNVIGYITGSVEPDR